MLKHIKEKYDLCFFFKKNGFCTLLGPQKSEKFAYTGGYEEYKYSSNKKKNPKEMGCFWVHRIYKHTSCF